MLRPSRLTVANVLCAAGLLFTAACGGGDSLTAPSDGEPFTGTWVGTFTQPFFAVGNARLELNQSGEDIEGSMRIEVQDQPEYYGTWRVSGTVASGGGSADLVFMTTADNSMPPGAFTCPGTGTLTLTDSDPPTLQGDARATSGGCPEGVFDLARE